MRCVDEGGRREVCSATSNPLKAVPITCIHTLSTTSAMEDAHTF